MTFEKLQVLELYAHCVPFEKLLGFVAGIRPTLRSLRMREVYAHGAEHLDAEQRLLEAHGGPDFKLDMEGCFNLIR